MLNDQYLCYLADFMRWKVIDEKKLGSRIKPALTILYQSEHPDEPEDSYLKNLVSHADRTPLLEVFADWWSRGAEQI